MSLVRMSSRAAVFRAIERYDELGAPEFLKRYGFGPARRYRLVYDGRDYDSKAIVGVAHGYEFPELGPLRSEEFSGGVTGAAAKLRELGFDIIDSNASAEPLARPTAASPAVEEDVTVILVGCVKGKLSHAAPARELYTSDLFRKRKAYAESRRCPWFILSAEHGLVRPDQLLAPYDRALKSQSVEYRRAWGERVATRLHEELDGLQGHVVEVHAGAAYADAIRTGCERAGAVVVTPLAGLSQGQQLAWYLRDFRGGPPHEKARVGGLAEMALRTLADGTAALSPRDFPWGRSDVYSPGVYSWWLDADGAKLLTYALSHPVPIGLVYAGQAGATAWPSGTVRAATLLSRIGNNHLRCRVTSSTWRLSLAAALYEALDLRVRMGNLSADSEDRLTAWMHEHLRLVVHPISHPDAISDIEARLLAALDPPLNLEGRPDTPVRSALSGRRAVLKRRMAESVEM